MYSVSDLTLLEIIGVVSFALSGAYVAIQKRMDIFGVLILAFTAACGGGIMRDVVMDRGIPAFFSNYQTVAIVVASVAVVSLFPGIFRTGMLVVLLDAAGLAFFAVDAGLKAIALDYNSMQFIFAAVITGVGGGVLRDVLAQRVPMIFRSGDLYAATVVAGCLFMWYARRAIGLEAASFCALVIIVVMRVASAYFKIGLPTVKDISLKK